VKGTEPTLGPVCHVGGVREHVRSWPSGRRGPWLARGYLIALVAFVIIGAFFELVSWLYPTDQIDFYGQVNLYTGVAGFARWQDLLRPG
jgi:hypothetical protein